MRSRTVSLVIFLTVPVFAGVYPCAPAQEAKAEMDRLETLAPPGVSLREFTQQRIADWRAAATRFPNDVFLHRRYQEYRRALPAREQNLVIAEYRARLDKNPDDPVSVFLYASSLIEARTPEAIVVLEKLLEREPDFPAAHLMLAEIRSSPNFRDQEKLRAHVEAVLRLCPSSFDAYRYARGIEDEGFARSVGTRLRGLIEGRSEREAIIRYPTLWALELRGALPDQEQERVRIRADLGRLRASRLEDNSALLSVLQDGYRIVGDHEGQQWAIAEAKRQLPQRGGAARPAIDEWRQKNSPPPGTPLEKWRDYYRALFQASGEWVRKWRDDPTGWMERLRAARVLGSDVPAFEVEQLIDGLSAAVKSSGYLMAMPPVSIQIAELCAGRGIRLEGIPKLVDDGMDEIDKRPPRVPSDLRPDPSLSTMLDMGRWTGWLALADAYIQLREPEKARAVLSHMGDFLERCQSEKPGDREISQWQKAYLERVAKVQGM